MSLRTRRFGKVVNDNVAGSKNNVNLIKATKRLNESDVVQPAVSKKTRVACSLLTNRENAENIDIQKIASGQEEKDVCGKPVAKSCRDLTKALETHVRKLDLDDKSDSQNNAPPVAEVTSRPLTRSASMRIACRPRVVNVPVDPALIEYRKSVDFSDPATYYKPPADLPAGLDDFDRSQLGEVTSEPHYAHDVFQYYKEQEVKYVVPKYMQNQPQLKKCMRAVLVDWMVEVQESFELNHETLYLAVKMVDHYFAKKFITKDRFQLLGATCLLMASKYDERIPAAIEDFLYICDDAYTRRDIILMEMDVFKSLDFFLGYPLSYRFLRRYARCSGLTMETLTLARYILETSLLDYDLVQERDSKIAAAALLLALKMKQQDWSTCLSFYSGYQEVELRSLMYRLNEMISSPVKSNTKTIKTKYSHTVFFEVAKIPALDCKF